MRIVVRSIVLCATALLALAACVPTDASEEPVDATPPEPEISEVASVNVVSQLLTFREVESDDETREFTRNFTLTIGESVTRIGEPVTGETPFGERELIRIRNSVGDEAYAIERYFVPEATLGIVTDSNAVVYSRPDLVSPTPNVLPRGSAVAIFPDDPGNGFIEVTSWDHESGTPYVEVFLQEGDVSTDRNDVQAGLLLFVARQTAAEVAREELLVNAESLGNTAFVDDIRRELAIARGEDPEDAMPSELADIETEEFAFTGVINANATVVYRFPDAEPDYQVTTLDEGAIVDVEERTVDAFTVEGETSSWFRIANPAGWVFGSRIDPQ